MTTELHLKYRPTTLKQLVGQPDAVRDIRAMFKQGLQHAILLTGPSGCGKTSTARIIAFDLLRCNPDNFYEINAADFRGIDTVREVRMAAGRRALGGGVRVWLVDECHKLSNDAQTAALNLLEEPPSHVYFILATTDPQKLIPTVRTRLTPVHFKPVSKDDLKALVTKVAFQEDLDLSDEVLDKLVESAAGSPRQALVLLEKVSAFKDDSDRLDAIANANSETAAIEVARTLFNPKATWATMCSVLRKLGEEDWEGVRYLVLSYATKVLTGGNGKLGGRAATVIDRFRDNWFDCKKAGLVLACYEVYHRGKD